MIDLNHWFAPKLSPKRRNVHNAEEFGLKDSTGA